MERLKLKPPGLLIAVSHPLTGQEGVRTETVAPGLSVHIRETRARITQGSNVTHPKESGWRNAPPSFARTITHTHTLKAMMATSEAQRGDLVVPYTCQKQMLRMNQREAQAEDRLMRL